MVDVRGDTLGRFVLLEVLGAGGMGIVYAAYDPQLDRKVALKLLHPDDSSEEARARLLREAQAMAKINHPNVVTVHEAGTIGEQVYIAMEFCDGGTLRTWLGEKPRSRREILDTFAQAGLGLAAAHDAGLVHRDFKPQNVLVGSDGVVRVTDFGLASLASGSVPPELITSASGSMSTPLSQRITRTGATIGTPSYMAPEQFARRAASPRTDQFAFCVALYEALYGDPPFPAESPLALAELVQLGRVSPPPAGADVPGWLRGVLLRGLSVDDAKRFPTMRELLAALARDPGRRLRRWGLGIGGAALFVTLLVALRPARGAECAGGAERRASIWNLERRARLTGAFLASGRSYAAHDLGKSTELIDSWASSWEAGYHDACVATRVNGEQSESLLDRRMQCLARKLQEASATIDLLANGGDALDHALDALFALPSVAPCADATGLLADAEPPGDLPTKSEVAVIQAEIARARSEDRVGHYRQALAIARHAVTLARAIHYPPILADALIEQGNLEIDLTERTAAETLDEAMRISARIGAGSRFVEAVAALVYTLANDTTRHDAASEIAKIADGIAEHANVSAEIAMRLDESVGLLLQREGHPDAAKVRFEHAIARGDKDLAPDAQAIMVAITLLGNLAQEQGHLGDAERLAKRSLELEERAYGPDHPMVSGALNNLAIVYKLEHKFGEAKQLYERALAIRIAMLGPEHPDVAQIYQNLGSLAAEQGDSRAAIDYSRKSLALLEKRFGSDSFQIVGALSNLGIFLSDTGDYPAARAIDERAVRIAEHSFGPDHISVATPLQNLGAVVLTQGKVDEAIAIDERALRITKHAYGPDHPDVADQELNIASVLRRQHKYPESLAMFQQAIAAVKKAYGEQHGHVAMAMNNLAALQSDMGDHEAALRSYQDALPILEASFGKDHIYCSFPLLGIANELVELHRAREAMAPLERSIALRTATGNPQLLAEARFMHADVLAALGDRTGALADARAALAGFEAVKSQEDIDRVRAWLAKQ